MNENKIVETYAFVEASDLSVIRLWAEANVAHIY